MDDLQIVFSILGVLLILAIIGHGMWTIRKNDRAAEAQAKALAKQRQQRDQSGFDADGIGEVRVVRGEAKPGAASSLQSDAHEIKMSGRETGARSATAASRNTGHHSPRDSTEASDFDTALDSANAAIAKDAEIDAEPPQRQDVMTPDLNATMNDELPVDSDAFSMRVDADERLTPSSKPAAAEKVAAPEPAPATQSKPAKPEQMDLHIDEVTAAEGMTAEPEEVIALHVKGDVQGDILLQQMTELGFKFGEFDIFHRHETTAGTGPVLFSLANMFNPGTFDIDAMETFKTQGVALFLALPVKGSAQQAFTMMHNAAQKLAAAIGNGQVLDEHRNPLTRQTVQHIQQRIREFERRQLLRNHKLSD